MNHCLLEVEVLEAPQVRYTQENQTPVAEMTVRFDGLRPDDPPGQLKVVGWGNLAQDLQNRVRVGQRLVLEGRMRMNTVSRQDGIKEKRAEFTLARLHPLGAVEAQAAAGSGGYGAGPASAEPTARGGASGYPSARPAPASPQRRPAPPSPAAAGGAPSGSPTPAPEPAVWNSAPLVPPEEFADDDDIPF
ncbi:MAG: single-stranded DNA-binding protein [Synechococcaceae cyanobacterium ELA739]